MVTKRNSLVIVTVVTRNYSHYAQVLMKACSQFHPEADLVVCYVDRPSEEWLEKESKTQIIYGDQLGIPNWSRFSFQYTPFELACALKPFITSHLIDLGFDQVVYLDGDMILYGPFDEVLSALEHDSIVLTPHLLTPLPEDGKRPHESAFLVSGTYNAGFYAVKNDRSTKDFLQWWQNMCSRLSIVDLAASLFVDQKWLGLVPGLFAGVRILRHPGYNAGHWSLSQFKFQETPASPVSTSGVSIDGKPLVLFHFSGMTPNKPSEYLTSQTRTSLASIPSLERLVTQYHTDLATAGMSTYSSWGCEFDCLNDGTPIHPAWREAIRQSHKSFVEVEDPFDVRTQPRLLGKYQAIQPGAYKWRRDWRLKWPAEQGVAGTVRKTNNSLKSFLKVFRGFRRSA